MDERGDGLTASNAAAARRSRASAHLGSTLRTILIDPRRGFENALAALDRRAQVGARPTEGIAPYVLTAIGGAGAMLLWLKVGTILGTRRVAPADFRWSFLVVALVGAALLALLAQSLWGVLGRSAVDTSPSAARFVWGASAAPQIFAVGPLLGLDLLLVGSETFTAAKLTDPLAAGWAALSIALSISVAVWSMYLFYRGVQVAGDLSPMKAILSVVLGVAAAASVTVVVGLGLQALAGG